MNIDLHHLNAFLSAARHRNFTRAAKALDISQPSFTVQIRKLETELGVRLLDRNTRSVQLTRVGRDLFPVLERLVGELQSLLATTKESSEKRIGRVSISALPSLAATILPPLLARLKTEHPGVSVHLKEAPAKRVIDMVRDEETDFGLGWVKEKTREIKVTPLFTDRMAAIFKQGSPLENLKTVTLRELVCFPLILTDRDSSVCALVDDAIHSLGAAVLPAWETTYMSTALALVGAGLGVAVLPAIVLEMEARRDLRALPIEKPNLDRRIGLIQKRGRTLSPAAEVLFRACLRDARPQGLSASLSQLAPSPGTRSGRDVARAPRGTRY
jgi:DNA-binding transcriptional LysR family regulator